MHEAHQKSLLVSADDSILVVIDIQERLLPVIPVAARETTIRNVRTLLHAARELDVPVILMEQYPKGLGVTTPEVSAVLPEGTPCIAKTCFSCTGADGFRAALAAAGRRQVILAGMESHVCILQTALGLLPTADVFVVENACCARTDVYHNNGINRMRQAGVAIVNHESVILEWLRDSTHERFKTISALLR